MKWLGHLRTVCHHKWLVMNYCFRLGLYWQGLTHDLSKFSPTEFRVGAKYFQGDRSPNEMERLEKGYSTAWLHHKGRNRHHLEYWIDYSLDSRQPLAGMKMPPRYVAEMLCDRLAACRTYRGQAYMPADPYEYYLRSKHHYVMHPDTQALLEKLLRMIQEEGEEATLRYIRQQVL
ncbi:MAG: DUF5662 family protein [Eubacteriales bacterium]|jgi:hypothetical protein